MKVIYIIENRSKFLYTFYGNMIILRELTVYAKILFRTPWMILQYCGRRLSRALSALSYWIVCLGHINTSIYGSWRKSRCSFKGCWKVLPCRYPHTHHSCQQCPDNGPLKLYLICFIYMFSFSIIYCPLSYKLGSLFSYFSLNLQRIRNQWQNFWNYLSYTI